MSGDIYLGSGISWGWAALICLVVVCVVVLEYGRMHRRGTGFRVGLTLVRSAALVLILGALFQPLRVDSVPEERERSLLVLVDVSESMGLPLHEGGETRLEWVRQLLFVEEGLVDRLNRKFRTRVYGFDRSVRRLWEEGELSAEGKGTHLGVALEQGTRDLGDAPLAGILLISDGADNSGGNPLQPAYGLRERGIPVHILAVGREDDHRDLRLVRVEAPEQVELGSWVEVEVEVAAQGYAGRDIRVEVESGGRVVAEEKMRLMGDGTRRVELQFQADVLGIRHYAAQVEAQTDEILADNNRQSFAVEVTPREERAVLFLDGRPRPEFAYIRRALERDEELLVEGLVVVNDKVEYRMRQPDGPGGEGLQGYDVVVLGDVAAEWLLEEGEEELHRFVGNRGGGLLVLGSAALADAGQPLQDLLPVRLPGEVGLERGGFRFRPSGEGQFHPILEQLGAEVWSRLPKLTGYLRAGRAKPGARVLFEERVSGEVLMATQRYGAGRVAFFAPYSSWRWRAYSPAAEEEYERFWMQTVRWLAGQEEQAVALEMEKFVHEPGAPVELLARVWDGSYQPHARAQVAAAIRPVQDASKGAELVALRPTLDEPGLYEGDWQGEEGEYQVDVWAHESGRRIGEARGFFAVRASRVELEGRLADRQLLERLAHVGGGLFCDVDGVETLAEQIPRIAEEATRKVEEDLWDTPLLFGGILFLLSGEWLWRRRRGMV